MHTHIECVPCFFKQAIEASKLAGASLKCQQKIMAKVSCALSDFSYKYAPSYMGRTLYNIVIDQTKVKDPFKKVKQHSNKLALKLYPKLKRKVEHSKKRFLVATELAIAGNIIDFGVRDSKAIEEELDKFLKGNFNVDFVNKKSTFNFKEFKAGVKKAKSILYIGDNAGEIVFDKVLIEEILKTWPSKKIVYVVRENPIINDVTLEDAKVCGMDSIVPVISSGSDAPGVILKLANSFFLNLYRRSDLIISKGQGNFETLSSSRRDIYFLFRAKCPVVAQYLECNLGDVILKYKR